MRRFALALTLLFCTCPTQAEEISYHEASFSVSSSPIKAVLAVHTSADDFSETSVILFGDGRVEIEINGQESFERRLSLKEMTAILDLAVAHGLAEWDADTIRAQQLRDWGGKPFPVPVDSVRVSIQLSLEEYRRGSYEMPTISQNITIRKPSFAAKHFPKIPQFQGIVEVLKWAGEQTKLAGDPAQ